MVSRWRCSSNPPPLHIEALERVHAGASVVVLIVNDGASGDQKNGIAALASLSVVHDRATTIMFSLTLRYVVRFYLLHLLRNIRYLNLFC